MSSLCKSLVERFTLRAVRGPISVAMIGIGGWGWGNALHIMRTRRYTLSGIYDPAPDPSVRFSRRYHVHAYPSLEALLAEPGVDAVCISVPNDLHLPVLTLCADAGKHVFIEKPLASSPEDCLRMGTYCDDKNVILQVGHQLKHEPAFMAIREIIRGGSLGVLQSIEASTSVDYSGDAGWRSDPARCPGASMEQLGVHLVDYCISLLGAPVHSGPATSDAGHAAMGLALQFPDDVCARVRTSFSAATAMQLEFVFSGGTLETDGQQIVTRSQGGATRSWTPGGMAGGTAQFLSFANCIEKGLKPASGASESALVMDAVRAAIV